VSEQTSSNWRPAGRDRFAAKRDDGLTSDDREELRRLRRENARLGQVIVPNLSSRFALESVARLDQRHAADEPEALPVPTPRVVACGRGGG
jgi:hypothetical protein